MARKQSTPTSIRMPDDLQKVLRVEAAERQWSVSKLIVNILKQWCERMSADFDKRGKL